MSKSFATTVLSRKASKAITLQRRASNRRTRHAVHKVEAMYRYVEPRVVTSQAFAMPVMPDDARRRLPKVEHHHTYGLKPLLAPLFTDPDTVPVIHRHRRNVVVA